MAVVGHVAHPCAAAARHPCARPARSRGLATGRHARESKRSFTPPRRWPTGCDPRVPAHRSPGRSPPSCTRPLPVGAPGTRRTSARCCARSASSAGRRLRMVGLGPRTNFRVRRWRDRLREFADPAAHGLAPRRSRPLRAGGSSSPRSRGVDGARRRSWRCLTASADLRAARVVGGYDLWPLPERSCAASPICSFLVGARDGRGRRRPRRAAARGSHHLRRGRRMGTGADARGAPARHSHGRAATRLHLPPLAQLPARARRDAAVGGQPGRPRVPAAGLHADVRRAHAASISSSADTFPPTACASRAARGSMRSWRRRELRSGGARARFARSSAPATDPPIVVVAAKYAQLGAAFARAGRRRARDARHRAGDQAAPRRGRAALCAGRSQGVATSRGAGVGRAGPAHRGGLGCWSRPIPRPPSRRCRSASRRWWSALPNNLSPFVDAGAMAGAASRQAVAPALRALLYDREMRQRVAARQAAFMRRYASEPTARPHNGPPRPSFPRRGPERA